MTRLITDMSMPAMAKDAVNRAFEMTLAEGVRFEERRLLRPPLASDDRKESMAAFVEKRRLAFADRGDTFL